MLVSLGLGVFVLVNWFHFWVVPPCIRLLLLVKNRLTESEILQVSLFPMNCVAG